MTGNICLDFGIPQINGSELLFTWGMSCQVINIQPAILEVLYTAVIVQVPQMINIHISNKDHLGIGGRFGPHPIGREGKITRSEKPWTRHAGYPYYVLWADCPHFPRKSNSMFSIFCSIPYPLGKQNYSFNRQRSLFFGRRKMEQTKTSRIVILTSGCPFFGLYLLSFFPFSWICG